MHLHIRIFKKFAVLLVPIVVVENSKRVLVGHVLHGRRDLRREGPSHEMAHARVEVAVDRA